jgi:hypothetical protein
VESPLEPRVAIPPDLVTQLIGETLSLGENYATFKIQAVAQAAGLSRGEINPQLQRAMIGEKRKQIVADLTPLALQEWGLDPQISPTAAIGLMLGPWLFASCSAYFTLAALAAEKWAVEKRRGEKVEKEVETP